jgi:aryl-alcohol dehydrogenase-like predicted oxidoreductase
MDAAIDAGINLLDTADVYGGPQTPDMKKGYGISEETIGRWLQRSGRRDEIVLASKVHQPMGLGPNDRRLSVSLRLCARAEVVDSSSRSFSMPAGILLRIPTWTKYAMTPAGVG